MSTTGSAAIHMNPPPQKRSVHSSPVWVLLLCARISLPVIGMVCLALAATSTCFGGPDVCLRGASAHTAAVGDMVSWVSSERNPAPPPLPLLQSAWNQLAATWRRGL